FDTPLPPYNHQDPYATFLSISCLDFLLIEIVPMAYRLSSQSTTSSSNPSDAPLSEDEQRDAVFFRLDSLGYRVGIGLVERSAYLLPKLPLHRYSTATPPGAHGF